MTLTIYSRRLRRNLADRGREAAAAESIVSGEVERYQERLRARLMRYRRSKSFSKGAELDKADMRYARAASRLQRFDR